MHPGRVCAGLAATMLLLAGAPPALARGGQPKPSGEELWRAYPLEPTASATAAQASPEATISPAATTAPPSGAASPAATFPAARGDGGAPVLPLGLGALVLAGAAGVLVARRRRGREAAAPAPPPERRAAQIAPEGPWPAGSDDLWRCEIAPAGGALSARVRAAVYPPRGAEPATVKTYAAPPSGPGWQAPGPAETVSALAASLEADGWDPVGDGGDVRRFCWRHEGAPHTRIQETAWST